MAAVSSDSLATAFGPMSNPFSDQPPPYNPPAYPQPPYPPEGDSTGGVIPYKNVPALLAYYLGILSLVCCIFGIPFGIVPLVLGIVGLKRRAANPVIKGSAHAWIGIVLGRLNIIFSILFIVVIVIGAVTQ
jgi:hypothetical protein